ncbi:MULTISPECIES: hypothetical protein [Deinococcus]|jgi:hypothetical protein|uniref:Uncharacterized protein n=1 Tax=Deinococcus soli (ex Cha et al. 2016) TaxID=1309411 RepID=A0ACC6KQI2_9DEIO|nr:MULTISPECIES: hypothetical protein [Deinococcus]MDR6331542.1 hypothetical protein [Deinococcus soli (ex Cha et al. 2016)]MDR6754712.1 hypothetical protein [Deinococcus soli (ex Cha et al. 2016)]GHF78406.1 hypothetical protein GCM10017782_15530 [Deinococcus ficus]
MARKKGEFAPQILPVEGAELMDMLQQMNVGYDDLDSVQAMSAAVEFEKSLLQIAHTMAQQAIPITTPETEADRVKAAGRQTDLLLKLFDKLQDAVKTVD